MAFLWTSVLRWILPSIPEVLSTVRDMRREQQAGPDTPQGDLRRQLEQLEKARELQSQLNEKLTKRLQQLERRLHLAVLMAIFGLILAVVALAVAVFR